MKTFNYLFTLIFIIFAALQYNDPDPFLWIPIYLYPAFICFQEARNIKVLKELYQIGFIGFVPYAIYKMFDTNGIIDWIKFHNASSIASTMKAETPWVEESREFFGLAIILIVMAINYKKTFKK
ncbi:MAG: hypothetical protein RL387_280 [Bacteroidota bacterium]|jgi:hypothetical protein